MTTPHSRSTLERWAQRLDLELQPADQQTRMDAASCYEPIPRWQLESPRTGHRDDVHGFRSLAEVAEALEHRGIDRGREDAAPAARIAPADDWSPGALERRREERQQAAREGLSHDAQSQAPEQLRRRQGLSL